MMDATVYLLKFGCTLCPASLIVRPWLTTWSTKVARIPSSSSSSSYSYYHSLSCPSSSSYSHYVSNVGLHYTKTEGLTCGPFLLKLRLLIVELFVMSCVQSRAIVFRILNNSVFPV
ncbi:hypothetical protein GOODEAATRI_032754 [Goodea atripinnis]|uniref:Secreted protein n=1 Tax=Goodea atripinnis TaxID=208336 RepID=A0ABV0P9N3_9TELE